ncbi:MAG: urease accessory protein UreD, partial [Sphingomonadales bacterium]
TQNARLSAMVEPAEIILPRTHGALSVGVKHLDGQSRLSRLRQEGAYKAFFPQVHSGGPLEAVLVNTSGGLTGGDSMSCDVTAHAGSRVMVTPQASEKIYKSLGPDVRVKNKLTVEPSATLLWCPQDTLMFEGARLHRNLSVDMAPDATLVLLESITLGRTARGEQFDEGCLKDCWRVHVDGALVHAEAATLDGNLRAKACLAGMQAMATLLIIGPQAANLPKTLVEDLGIHAALSHWTVAGTDKTVIRCIAPDSYRLWPALGGILAALKVDMPRVWRL